jgi:hypothetical protein
VRTFLSIFLFVCYSLSTCGISISRHYCGGHLEAISLFKTLSECCCGTETTKKCSTQSNNHCCQDEVSYSKLQTDQSAHTEINANPKLVTFIPTITQFYFEQNSLNTFTDCDAIIAIAHPPPIAQKQKLFLQFQSWKLDC